MRFRQNFATDQFVEGGDGHGGAWRVNVCGAKMDHHMVSSKTWVRRWRCADLLAVSTGHCGPDQLDPPLLGEKNISGKTQEFLFIITNGGLRDIGF